MQFQFLDQHAGVKNIGLIYVYILCIIPQENFFADKILDRSHFLIHKALFAGNISGKAANAIINGDNIRIETPDQIVQRVQRRDFPTGGNINIDPKCGDFIVRMTFRKGVHCDMALVQMCVNIPTLEKSVSLIAGWIDAFFSDQYVDRSSLRFVILSGNIQHRRTDHFGDITENIRQTFGIILFIDVADIVLFFPFGLCITYIKNIKAQRLSEIVKSI